MEEKKSMEKNQKCKISTNSPFHKGREGFFQFFGEGASLGTAVLSEKPTPSKNGSVLFAVAEEHLIPLEE